MSIFIVLPGGFNFSNISSVLTCAYDSTSTLGITMNYYIRIIRDSSLSTKRDVYIGSYLYNLDSKKLIRRHIIQLDIYGYNCFDYSTYSTLSLQEDLRVNEVYDWIKNNKWEI